MRLLRVIPADVHCGCGRKRLCSRSGCEAGMALGLGAGAAVGRVAAEAPSSRWWGVRPAQGDKAPPSQRAKPLHEPASTASHVTRSTVPTVMCARVSVLC